MSAPVVTAITERWRTQLDDAVRAIAWSPFGRLMVVCADGRSMVDVPGQVTEPMCTDPLDASWLGERRVAVVDAVMGVVFAGSGDVDTRIVANARRIGSHGGRTVVAANDALFVFGHPDVAATPERIVTGVGHSHALAHTRGALWAVGGTTGLALVDAGLGCLDIRVEFGGVGALAVAHDVDRLVLADLAGSLHVVDLKDPAHGVELDGYPDPVRRLAIAPTGDVVVAAADDEITWWWIGAHGQAADAPDRGLGHDVTITALAMSDDLLVATGDASGLVRVWSPHLTDYPVATATLAGEITTLEWSPDGRQLAIGAVTGEVALVDVSPGELA